MKGIGYSISAGALAVAAFTVSPWLAIGAVACGLLAAWVLYRERQRRLWRQSLQASRQRTVLIEVPPNLPPGEHPVQVTNVDPTGQITMKLDKPSTGVPEHRPCETAPPGTGARCSCSFDCDNYWIRAKGRASDG